MKTFAQIAFTPAVQALQEQSGSRAAYARAQSRAEPQTGLGSREVDHLSQADSFYMATVSETGWPYVQHRGGPPGFLKVVSPTQLAFADFGGNRQFVSVGNATRNNRASLIVMDYRNQRRMKLMGWLRFDAIDDANAAIASVVRLPGYRARVERVGVIDVEAIDWNCPQHIPRKFSLADIEAAVAPLHDRIRQLEAKVAALPGARHGRFTKN